MIDFMCKEKGADINKFHLIGHSLGAHTVGYAGMYTKTGKIPRITGTVKHYYEHITISESHIFQNRNSK